MTIGSLVNYTGTILLGGETEIPWHQHFRSLEVEIVSGGAWTARMILYDPDGDRIEALILETGQDRIIDFSFGWDDPDHGERRTFSGYMLQYQPEFMPNGTIINLEIIARPAGPMVLDKQIVSFGEGRRASEIVEEIAARYQWDTSDTSGRNTIEPTEPPLETPFNTMGESAFKFIRDTMLKQAVNKQGASGYLAFFDERGAFHFHTPDFLPASTHRYRFARDGAGEVLSFSPQDTSIFGVISGGGNSRYTSAASLQGGTAEKMTSVGGGVNGEGAPTVQDSAAKPDLGTGTHSFLNLNVRNPEEVERTARARYETFRRYAFQANLRVVGTHAVRVVDYIDFEFIKENGELHYLSGNFQVFQIKHSLGVGEHWTTEFQLLRAGIPSLTGTSPLTVSKTVTPTPVDDDGDSVAIAVEA